MHILVGTDLSEGSRTGARWAFQFAHDARSEDGTSRITVLHAAHARYPQILDTDLRLDNQENIVRLEGLVEDWVSEAVGETDVPWEAEVVAGEPEETLADGAERHDSEWIALGMTGRGALERLVVGSTCETLAHGPPTRLAICHPDAGPLEKGATLVAGVDFTDASVEGLRMAGDLARQVDASLHVVHVAEPPTYEAYPYDTFSEGQIRDMDQLIVRMEKELGGFLDEHGEHLEGVEWSKTVLSGYPTRELTWFAEEEVDADGIALGTAGRSAFADFVMGSVSRGVVKHMGCNVYLAPPA